MEKSKLIFVNFIAEINDKTSSLLMFLLTEQLRSGMNNFRINISSGGGMVFHAVALYNFLSGLKDVYLHTHNLGQIDSAANLIFLAGQQRTASKASSFLLHPPKMGFQAQGMVQFSLQDLKERTLGLEKDERKIAEIIATRLNKDTQSILQMFERRETHSSEEAKNLGFIHSIEEFVAEPGTPIFTITNQA